MAGESRGCAAIPQATPAFSMAFFTHGDYLVPSVRDFLPPGRAPILSPGRVWSEPGDGGMSRASLPFTVVNPIDNAAHNGLATFPFDDTRVSALRVQVVQSTRGAPARCSAITARRRSGRRVPPGEIG